MNNTIRQGTKQAPHYNPVKVNHSNKMFPALSQATLLIIVTAGQSLHPKCGSSDCVSISNCPSFLKLVLQMKSGDHDAKKEVMSSQCGFERSLPKVCCHRNIDVQERPIPSPKVQTLEPQPTPAAFVQTAKQTSLRRRVPNRFIQKKDHVEIPSDCGVTNVFSTRIVNGRNTKKNAWPWIAALGYREPKTGKIFYLCGASLVTKKHLVTAAHCIRDDLTTVLLGEHIIGNDTDGANPEEFRIIKTKKHENFKKSTFTNDIAIVEIEKEVTFKTGIQPVCLPSKTPRLMQEKFVSEGVHIAGWGRTSWRGQRSNALLQGILRVFSNQECKEKFAGFEDVDIANSKLCAGDRNDVGACLGDSGGPLVTLKRADDKRYRYHLIGVVSSGYSKCHAVKGFPDVYTRVTSFDQWIRDTINK